MVIPYTTFQRVYGVRIVQSFRTTGEVPNVVNRLARSSATHVLTIRHRNRPGVLAHVFGVLAWFSVLAALGLGPAGMAVEWERRPSATS